MNGAAEKGKSPSNERDPAQEHNIKNGFSTVSEAGKSEDAAPNISKTRITQPEPRDRASEVPKATNESASWLNWFSKSEIATEDETSMAHRDDDASSVDKNRPQSHILETPQDAPTLPKQRRNSDPSPVAPNAQQEEAPRSWLSLWGNASTQTNSSSSASAVGLACNPQSESNGTESQNGQLFDADLGPVSLSQRSQQSGDGTKSSYGWAFWSKDQPKGDEGKTQPGNEFGELALAGSSSQSKPETAVLDEARGIPNKVGKRQKPQSLEIANDSKKPQGIGDDAQKKTKPQVIPLAPKITSKVDAIAKAKRMPENLLLPSFRNTYTTVERPSLIQQISRFLQISSSSKPKHVNIVQNPPRIKRALAIVCLIHYFLAGISSTWLMHLFRAFMATFLRH